VATALFAFAVALIAPIYAFLAWQHPILGRSPVAVLFLTLVLVVCLLLVFARQDADALHPLRLIGAVFLLTYCVSPLLRTEIDWFFRTDRAVLLDQAASFVFFALIFLVLGYSLPLFPRAPASRPPTSTSGSQPIVRYYALALFGLGLLAYGLLVVQAGGLEGMIASDTNRVDFAKGVGYLLFASYFMFSGGALYFASSATAGTGRAWLRAWPIALAFVLFLLLQNRSRSVQCLVIFLVIWHYQVGRLRLARLVPFGAALAAFLIFIGYARHPRIRPFLLTDPMYVVRDAWRNFGELGEEFFGSSLNRLQQVMLALDNWPERASYEWGASLLAAFNPIVRLVGLDALQYKSLGNEFFQLAHPEIVADVQTGFHPSLLGELLANFPWYLALFAAAGFGLFLRFLYSTLVVNRRSFVALAAYAAIIFRVVDMVIVGVGQLIFQILVVLLPILLVLPLARGGRARAASSPDRALGEGLPQARAGP
jgi:hypothetical protein